MKILLYCTKAKPYLYKYFVLADDDKDTGYTYETSYSIDEFKNEDPTILNGTIPCECDFEIEEIKDQSWQSDANRWYSSELLEKSCLHVFELNNYLKGKNGKAIHIKNLHIFDKSKIYIMQKRNKIPQNMCYVWDGHNIKYVLIPIHPKLMCKILNKECTIIIKKKVLKEML